MGNQAQGNPPEAVSSTYWQPQNFGDEATTPRVVQALHNEHIFMSNMLDSLSEQVELLTDGKDTDFNLLFDIIDYMQNFPDRYHHPREDILYQRMALRDEQCARDVQILMEEHRTLEHLADELAACIKDIHALPTVLKKERARDLCEKYVELLREHMNLEEGKVLPRAAEVLHAEDWFIVEQQSSPIEEIPINNVLTDNYDALQRHIAGRGERFANDLLLAEFLGSGAILEVAGIVGADFSATRSAVKSSAKAGVDAYRGALNSWLPWRLEEGEDAFQNPVVKGIGAIVETYKARPKPGHDRDVLGTVVRNGRLFGALVGGRGKAVAEKA